MQERSISATASGDIYSEAGYNANLNTSGYKPAYSDLVSKLADINSKLTLCRRHCDFQGRSDHRK